MSSLGKMFGILLLAASSLDVALATVATICSNQNTGSSFQAVANNYQSNGACTSTCSGYSFAIVQYDQCWCSNIAPGSTVSSGQCNQGCPGYPLEKCGNQDSGLYGYIDLGKAPQGTANSGGSGSASSSKPASTTQQSSSPPTDTVTSLATVIQVSSVIVSPSSSPSPSSTSTSSSSSSTWTPTPSASVMTVSGSVKTIVVTPTMAPQATTTVIAGSSDTDAAQSSSTSNGGFFSNKGAVAGVFTVVGLIAAGLIAAAVWFFFWRRKKEQEGSERLNSFEEERGSRPPTFMSRRTSELGLKTDLGPGATRGSDEKTPTGSHMTPGTMSRRTSIPLTDSRLNAAAMFHDNGSHMSVASLQDNQDYSRPVLQVANPDRPGSSAIEDD